MESSFTLLHDIGTILLDENESIRFTIDAYHGYPYISVRRYIKTDVFTGATRDGITLTPEILRALEPRLSALPNDPKRFTDGIIGKFAKRPGICVVVGIGSFRGMRGLDLRQQEQGVRTKKGLWITLTKWAEVQQLFRKTREVLDSQHRDDF